MRVAELVAHAQDRVQRVHRALEDDRDLAPAQLAQLARALLHQIDTAGRKSAAAVDDAAAGDHRGRAQQAAEAERQRRLATAALAREADGLAAPEREVDVVDGLITSSS